MLLGNIKFKYKNLPIQFKASLWFLICSFVQKGISVIVTPIFTRLVSASEYGAFNVFCSWQGIITIFTTLNLSWGVYNQGLVKYENDRKTFSSSMQGLNLTLVSIWVIIYLLTCDFWNKLFSLTTLQMVAMFIIIWTTAVFEFWAAEQRVEFKYKKLIAITLTVSVASPLLGIILMLYGKDKVTARIIALAITGFLAYTGLFIKQMYHGKKFFSKRYWQHALSFNIPLIPHYLSQTLLNSSDRIMIEHLFSSEEAGLYSLAYSLALIMTLFNSALMQTLSPWIYTKIKQNRISDIAQIAYPALSLIAIVNIFLIAFAPEMIKIFAPANYYDAIWVVPPIAMSVFFMFAYDLFAKFEFYFEKTKFITIATFTSAIFNIVLNYIFMHIFGYYAAGYTTLFCYIIYALFHYIFMRKICINECDGTQPYSIKYLFCISLIFMTIGFSFTMMYNHPFIRYLTVCSLSFFTIIKRQWILENIKRVFSTR